jgi:hypothetical protein
MAWKTPRFRVAQASSYDQLQPSTILRTFLSARGEQMRPQTG